METTPTPMLFHILRGEALDERSSPYGAVGKLFSGEEIEAVWVAKQDEEIDSGWFSQPMVDLILIIQGQLRVDFADPDLESLVMQPGDLLVLPPNMRCRAYRWPRSAKEATVFVACYPRFTENGHKATG